MKPTSSLLPVLLSLCLYSCSPESPETVVTDANTLPAIQLGGKAYLKVYTKSLQDSIHIQSAYWPLLQMQEYFTDKHRVVGDTSILLSFEISVPSRHQIDLGNQKEIPVFLVPSDTLAITANYSGNPDQANVSYTGTYGHISQYLYEKPKGVSFSILGAQLSNNPQHAGSPEATLQRYKLVSDSIKLLQHTYVAQHKDTYRLPDWFVEYEKAESTLFAAYHQQIVPYYWKEMLQTHVQVPDGYYGEIEKPDLSQPTLPFTSFFYAYMSRQTIEQAKKKNKSPAVEKQVKVAGIVDKEEPQIKRLMAGTAIAEATLSKDLLHPFLTFYALFNTRNPSNYEVGKHYLQYLESKNIDTAYASFIREKLEKSRTRLTPGTQAPGFYLLSSLKEEYRYLADYKGKIVLLNFWFPGCKPCIAEIPHEKELLSRFSEKEFAILNVCFEATVEQWQQALERYQLGGANLVVQGNWVRKLKEAYAVGGFPHYVLIDQQGRIIENNTYRPSNPQLSQLIERSIKTPAQQEAE